MPSYSETLRQERENHSKTLEEMAEATGIRQGYLEALEHDRIQELPGRAFGKLYIRAYAEVLGFDPRPLIEAYDREQNHKEREALPPPAAPAPGPRPVEAALARWREQKAQEATEAADATEERTEEDALDPTPEQEPEPPVEPAFEELEPLIAPTLEPELQAAPQPVLAPSRPPRPRWLGPAAVLAILVVGVLAGVWLFRSGEETSTVAPPTAPPQEGLAATEPPATDLPAAEPLAVDPPPAPAASEPEEEPPRQRASGGTLSVSEFGTGRRIAQRSLADETDRFARGETAYFFTRVVGGRAGQRIRHVWFHEGSAQQTIRLRLGSSSWRTHSSKRLLAAGSWAVEARDEEGNVLARATFVCAP